MVSSQCLAITFLMGYLPVRIARIRILSGLGNDALGYLLKKGDITDAEYRICCILTNADLHQLAVFLNHNTMHTCRIHRPTSDKKGQ